MQPEPLRSESTFTSREISGIRGWLLIAALYLVFSAVMLFVRVLAVIQIVLGPEHPLLEEALPHLYSREMQLALRMEVLSGIPLIFAYACVLSMFFRKKRNAPKAVIVIFCVQEAWALLFSSWESAIEGETFLPSALLYPLITIGIWIPYFCVSLRVKNTFCRD